MEIFGLAIIALLSFVIAWQTWKNGKWIKDMLRTIHEEGEKRHREVIEEGEKRHREVIKLFEKMDERTAKISEQIERLPEKVIKSFQLPE